ncbi:hypothetical protein KR222_004490 [Zaprionus bogoriensis]|nr:hypothetical protein KR222_004490 [Zaprionus bogoriensis]
MILLIYTLIGIGLLLPAYSQQAVTLPLPVPVSECPAQSVPQLRAELEAAGEVSLLFYYVSWSSDARQARLVYDGVAHYYRDYASFGAVDCWHLLCNCSRTHRQLPGMAINGGYPDKWPTLIVQYGRQLRLQYQGAWHFEDLTRFMNNLIQPIDRVHSTQELSAIWKVSDAVVLALLDSADGVAYRRFVATALHWLEFDPERNVRFAVTFGPSAKRMLKLETLTLPQLVVIDSRHSLHSYNESSATWRPMEILHWLRPKVNPLLAAGYGTPVKIALKARHVPVLAMGIRMHQQQSGMLQLTGEDLTRKENNDCERYWQQDVQQAGESQTLSVPVLEQQYSRQCSNALRPSRASFSNYYRLNGQLNQLWSQYTHQEPRLQAAGRRLLELHTRYRCLAHTHAQQGTPALRIGIAKLVTKYGQLIWQHSPEHKSSNRSLAVVLFDAYKYRDYLQQLGIDQQQQQQEQHHHHRRDSSAVQVFIVDAAAEALYLMPHTQAFSYLGLKEFIKHFYAKQLPRLQRSAVLPAPAPATPYVQAYNRQLLLQALQRSNATSVVLIHRPDCALSMVMSQVVMQVAALLRSPQLQFIRFDGQANDLPWELSMPSTPALLVFPEDRSSESVLYPSDMRADTANVMSFVLAQLQPEQQLRVLLASCRRRMRHARSCLDFAAKLVLQHVSQYLKYWEIFERERDQILSHLKQLHELHIAIESSAQL